MGRTRDWPPGTTTSVARKSTSPLAAPTESPKATRSSLAKSLVSPNSRIRARCSGVTSGVRQELFVVLRLGIDAPEIVLLMEQEVPGRQHARQHRMILVVVAMQPVATDGLEILEPVDERPNGGQAIAVAGIVDRIRLFVPEHASVLDVRQRVPARSARARACQSSMRSGSGIFHSESFSVQKYSSPRLVFPASGTVGTPVLEVLDAADPDVGGVDVDPVVRKSAGVSGSDRR